MNSYVEFSIFIYVLCSFPGSLYTEDVGNILPEEYTLVIQPYLNNLTFQGKMSIKFSIHNLTKQITLRAEKIKPSKIILKPSYFLGPSEINVEFTETNGSWMLSSREELVGPYTLNITFMGQMSSTKEEEGLFYSIYIDDETKKYYDIYKQSPLAEECDFKGHMCVNILYQKLWRCLEENNQLDAFYSPNISTNEVGFIIHQLKYVTTPNLTVLTKSEAMHQTNETLSLMVSIVQLVQSWFPDTKVSKLNVVALPDVGSRMIFYPRLVFCREDKILFKNGVSNTKHQKILEEYVVHIVVGQLLMKLETLETPLFMGLATYIEQKILSQLDPTMQANEACYKEEPYKYISGGYEDSTNYSHKKFAGILRIILDDFASEETVINAVQQMLNESSPVTGELFFSIIERLSNESTHLPYNYSYRTILQPWIFQTGFPIVTVTTHESGIFIQQVSSTKSDVVWPIPLSCKCGTEDVAHEFQFWLTESYQQVTGNITCRWILCKNQEGLYRLNYDSFGWNMLAEQLILNHSSIPTDQRSILIDDIFYLAEQGLVNFTEVFHFTQYLAKEPDYLPWQIAALNFEKYIQLFYNTELAFNLQEYVNGLYSPYFNEVYQIKSLNESRIKRLATHESLYWGCLWRLKSCVTFTSELFKQWRSVSTGFPPDYKPASLCTGVELFPEMFSEVFDAFTESEVEGDRLVFLRALACTNSIQNITFLLELVFLDEKQMMLGHHSKLHLIWCLLENPGNVGTVIRFVEKNHDAAGTVVGLKFMSSVWTAIERSLHGQEDILLIKNMAKNVSLPLRLRERLSSILFVAGVNQKRSSELYPLLSAGLSHWVLTSSSVRACASFCVMCILVITLHLQR